MKRVYVLVVFAVLLIAVAASAADSPFAKEFKKYYGSLDADLLNAPAEVATVTNFVYEKDLARFTFASGQMFLCREVMGRPTTAVFIGTGNCQITVPSHLERMNLLYACDDSSVHDTFSVCFIRMADDLDLRLKEKFSFTKGAMSWKDYNTSTKQAQGEFFFRPIIGHERDNYFELLRSCYERSSDGYFWADFGRFNFCFNPNRPEQMLISYQRFGFDLTTIDGVSLQRKERDVYDDRRLSEIAYPVSLVGREVNLNMGGMDGRSIDNAMTRLDLLVNVDSIKFTSFYLNKTLHDDSVYLDEAPVLYSRRTDFAYVGVALPRYYHKGDTLHLKVWYHGRDYVQAFPFIEDPAATPIRISATFPKGYNLLMPGVDSVPPAQRGRISVTAAPAEPYRMYFFRPYTGSYDTITLTSGNGLPVLFLKTSALSKSKFPCFLSDDLYQPPIMDEINYFTARLGQLPGADKIVVYPDGKQGTTGVMEVPQVKCLIDGTGGLYLDAGLQAARLWFGNTMRLPTTREYWLADAIPVYLGAMSLEKPLGGQVFLLEMANMRDALYTLADQNKDQPLAIGDRCPVTIRVTKGAWTLHMLRYLMYDLDKNSDLTFLRFMNECAQTVNASTFTNADFEKLAEKYYGQPLGWFFDEWVYGRNIPHFDVKHTIEAQGSEWAVKVTVGCKDVLPSFTMPVICRVAFEDGSYKFLRETVTGGGTSWTLGPFSSKPKEFLFNAFYSVLAHE
ncbi:MAG: hypothetical protein HY851_02345 [candidate division Zixibacteria bacterium]|nr:hypothetical protein [candidate division Zixibacteria bacterium]